MLLFIVTALNLLNGVERKRQDSIAELIGTEQAYIDDMSIVHEVKNTSFCLKFSSICVTLSYFSHFLQVFENPLIQKGILSKEQLQKIFVNWKDIIVCNVMFLRFVLVTWTESMSLVA